MTLQSKPVTFSPDLHSTDAIANYWLSQVTLRLRREISWRWQQQGQSTASENSLKNSPENSRLPAVNDRLSESLDLTRYWQDKCHFFQQDVTARFLSDQLKAISPQSLPSKRGTFGWVIQTLALDDTATFVLALALTPIFDAAAGAVIATCQNNHSATQPTLALAQKLWDTPETILSVADSSHPLWRYSLLQTDSDLAHWDWRKPILIAPLIARQLLNLTPALPTELSQWPVSSVPPSATLSPTGQLIINRLQVAPKSLHIVPVQGGLESHPQQTIQQLCQFTQKPVAAFSETVVRAPDVFKALMTLCWLRGLDVYLPAELSDDNANKSGRDAALQTLSALPVTVFLKIRDRSALKPFTNEQVLPILTLPKLTYGDRIQAWYRALSITKIDSPIALQQEIAECARRFRYGPQTIERIAQSVRLPGPFVENNSTDLTSNHSNPSSISLTTACRAAMALDIGELAQPVPPRFSTHELVLPQKQHQQFQEIIQGMKALTQVHYQWGTARAWNECGLSVLFAGPPGTGKTMAAEALAEALQLPMYRIDLSQVVNKYIGETEKNLKRLFDTADLADTVLFFDEADALFGRRSEVKDAHDRYANLEISYLLERMERFKGLAILATNRQKDLDEAFLRRLRYIIEFPLPEEKERRRLWVKMIPMEVNATQLDIAFLARQFPLAGGHIRSIVFNACLQTAEGYPTAEAYLTTDLPPPTSKPPTLTMDRVMVAIKREYDKLNRSVSQSQFGPYAHLIERIDSA